MFNQIFYNRGDQVIIFPADTNLKFFVFQHVFSVSKLFSTPAERFNFEQ